MQKGQLKLNPEECVFGVSRGEVLSCLVSIKGIEANPDNIKAIVCMKPPQSKKDVQRLTCRIVKLNRFMEKIAERSLPFFKVLRGSDTFEWGPEQKEAFDALKVYFCNSHGCRRSPHTRKGIERGQEDVAACPNIFRVRSFGRLKNVLFRNGEDML
jgi:hypothetical protein